MAEASAVRAGSTGRLLYVLPVSAFVAIATALAIGLTSDPREIPSALIDKPVPEFSLPPVKGRAQGFSTADLTGQVSLVNVFASWCVPCRAEHPLLLRLATENVVPIYGINYKDAPDDAARWLGELGDPYTRTGADLDGRVSVDWGVYGVPETFVIDRAGRIVHKHVGALTPRDLNQTILPLIERLRR